MPQLVCPEIGPKKEFSAENQQTLFILNCIMKKIHFHSPEIDGIIARIQANSSNKFTSTHLANRIAQTLTIVQKIKPKTDFNDRIWTMWLRTERGDISVFGDYEELKFEYEITTYEEFVSIWEEEYPEKVKWYQVILNLYQEQLFFSIDSKCRFDVDLSTKEITGTYLPDKECENFILWLLTGLEEEVKRFTGNPHKYNEFIAKNLPRQKRFGKIKRMDLWEGLDDSIRFDDALGKENLNKFETVINKIDENRVIEKITANDFFSYCEICYDANEYFRNSKKPMNPVEKYKAFSDLRHGGLLDIDADSEIAFRKWYHGREWSGSHPWEICRGGNSTHISLQITYKAGGWQLYLAGYFRTIETIKMAIALFENDIPFILNKKEEMLSMVKGIDYLGIVPDKITAKYCHSLFPAEDAINDFINPWHDPELVSIIKKKAVWYPAEELILG